jgi:hypothetical protein
VEAYTLRLTILLRYTVPILLGFACTAAILSNSILETPILWVAAIEAARGIIILTLGFPASFGIAIAQAAQSLECLGFTGALGRFALLIWPNLLLGLLWQRYRLRGGLAAITLNGLWQLAIQNPNLWLLPAAGFITAATFLLHPIFFQKPVKHATETQSL